MVDILPYQFKPNHNPGEFPPEDDEAEDRPNLSNCMTPDASIIWCSCVKSTVMVSERECLCCREVRTISEVVHDTTYNCVTELEEFKTAVWKISMKASFNGYVGDGFLPHCSQRSHASPIGTYNLNFPRQYTVSVFNLTHKFLTLLVFRSYQFAAYKQFTYCAHSKLGEKSAKKVPSCVVKAIRAVSPCRIEQHIHRT
jgi:hypothetical protein